MIPASRPGTPERDAARFLCPVDMMSRNNSPRRHADYMNDHPGIEYAYGLKKVPSKSGMHDRAVEFSGMTDRVRELLPLQAGDDARGTLLGDSSGFSVMRYEDRGDAKRGTVSRRGFDKLHVLPAPHGMVAACAVTGGRRHDSPVFREMLEGRIPRGAGHVMPDAAYPCRDNCEMIKDGGRRPVMCPKSNMRPRGFDAPAGMPGWRRDDPDGFDRPYHRRSLAGTAFSVIRERFGATARARLEPVRARAGAQGPVTRTSISHMTYAPAAIPAAPTAIATRRKLFRSAIRFWRPPRPIIAIVPAGAVQSGIILPK